MSHWSLHWRCPMRSCFELAGIGVVAKEEADEFGLPVRSRLLENVRKVSFGRRAGNAAPPRGRRAAVAFQNFGDQARLRGGQAVAAAQIDLLPPAVDVGVADCYDGGRSPDANPRNIRERRFGLKWCDRHLEGRTGGCAEDFEVAGGFLSRPQVSRTTADELL